MFFHGRHQRFRRYAQERFVERTGQCHRPFVQRGHFVQQVVADDGFAAQFLTGGSNLFFDQRGALIEVGHHIGRTQFAFVFGRRVQHHRCWRVETVATGGIAGFQAQHFTVYYVVAEQHHQPLHRTHEFNAGSTPAHALRDWQLVEAVLHDGRQQLNGALTFDGALNHQLAILTGFQVSSGGAGTGRKAFSGFGQLAFGVVGDIGRWAVNGFFLIGLLGFQRGDAHGQTTWGGERHHSAKVQAGVFQALFNAGGKSTGQGFQCLRWQLFGTQFNQKILCTHYFFSWASFSAFWAS